MQKSILVLGLLAGCEDPAPRPADAAVVHRVDAVQIIQYDFSVQLNPMMLTIPTGTSANVEVKITRTGDMGQVDLALDAVPANVSATLDRTTLDKNTSSAQLTITAISAGSAVVTVEASGNVRHGEAGGLATKPAQATIVVP